MTIREMNDDELDLDPVFEPLTNKRTVTEKPAASEREPTEVLASVKAPTTEPVREHKDVDRDFAKILEQWLAAGSSRLTLHDLSILRTFRSSDNLDSSATPSVLKMLQKHSFDTIHD